MKSKIRNELISPLAAHAHGDRVDPSLNAIPRAPWRPSGGGVGPRSRRYGAGRQRNVAAHTLAGRMAAAAKRPPPVLVNNSHIGVLGNDALGDSNRAAMKSLAGGELDWYGDEGCENRRHRRREYLRRRDRSTFWMHRLRVVRDQLRALISQDASGTKKK